MVSCFSQTNQDSSTGTLLIRFRIFGSVCCLSHQETLTFWHRLLIRRGVGLLFRGGFNPRPRLSLPLPRAVGLQSDADLLAAEVESLTAAGDLNQLSMRLNGMLPEGMEVLEISGIEGKVQLRPVSTVYRWTRHPESSAEKWLSELQRCREQIKTDQSILLERNHPKKGKKTMDLREYIQSLDGTGEYIQVQCRVTPYGTLRIDELTEWFGLTSADLAEPVRRLSVQWKRNIKGEEEQV